MDNSAKQVQARRTFKAFREKPKTMLMVSRETGIMRANVCRYVATFRESNMIDETKKDRCPITNHVASFLTTDPDLFPADNQYSLFNKNIEG